MAKLTKLQEAIKTEIQKGRSISLYPTGDNFGYSHYYRWDDTKQVVRSKTLLSMKKKGFETETKLVEQIIKY